MNADKNGLQPISKMLLRKSPKRYRTGNNVIKIAKISGAYPLRFNF